MQDLTQLDFTRPWIAVLFLLPILLPLIKKWLKVTKPAIVFSDIRQITVIPTWRTQTIFIPSVCAVLAWICLVTALMGPRLGREETKITTEGIAIGMVLDISGSMSNRDMPLENGDVITRYETVEKVFTEFIRGSEEKKLKGRSNDMISLTIFGKYVDDLSPLTLDHDFVVSLMRDNIRSIRTDLTKSQEYEQQFGRQKSFQMLQSKNPIWQGTVIYDAVALASDVMNKSDDALRESQEKGNSNYKIKSKILIVLSDGKDEGSSVSEDDAAKVAKDFGIKVYTIAIHGQQVQQDIFGRILTRNTQQYDNAPLKMIAETTGGKFYKASDPKTLFNIIQDIEALEKSEIPKQVTMEYTPSHRIWLLAGLILLGLHLILKNTIYREAP